MNNGTRRPPIDRFREKYKTAPGPLKTDCWLWTAYISPYGYGQFGTGVNLPSGKPKLAQAHRWSYEYFVGPIPVGLELDHLCRIRRCVNWEHLEPVTRKVNVERGLVIGNKHGIGQTYQRGEKNSQNKLTPETVLRIRKDLRPNKEIAEEFNVHPSTVSLIKTRKTWKHL